MPKPTCPQWLNTEAKREWNRVVKQLDAEGRLESTDRAVLAVYCQNWSRLVEHEKILAEHESVWRAVGNQLHPHPAYKIILECQKTIEKYASLLGITPAARAKLKGFKSSRPDVKKSLAKPQPQIPAHLKIHA